MSRQFYIYLLPPDIESLTLKLKTQLNVSLLESTTLTPKPVEAKSCVCKGGVQLGKRAVCAACFIARSVDTHIRMQFIPAKAVWSVDLQSEAIEFSGCEFDENLLVRGRFYFQNDLLSNDLIIPKRQDFLTWADKVFRTVKKSLRRSKTMNAYIGEHAERWRLEGGRFAWMVTPGRGPLYEADQRLAQ